MTHTITITEEQRQLILLALAQLSLERPGWQWTLGETCKCLPGGEEMFKNFREANGDTLPFSNVVETCAKIVETWLDRADVKTKDILNAAVCELRQYAADLDKPENMGAARVKVEMAPHGPTATCPYCGRSF